MANIDPSSMSVAELKRELMALNDSSFVFNQRDELECALKSARKVQATVMGFGGSDTLGELVSDHSNENMDRDSTRSSWTSAGAIAASATGAAMADAAGKAKATIIRRQSSTADSSVASQVSSSKESSNLATTKGSGGVPDLASLGSASRGSSQSSASPSPARVGSGSSGLVGKGVGKGGGSAPPATVKEISESESIDQPPQATLKNQTSVDVDTFNEPDEEADKEANSRRLVEYFVMVSCVPIIPTSDSKSNSKAVKKLTKSRPPDPTRDNLNSRTKARFDVRRVHLSQTTAEGGGSGSTTGAGGFDASFRSTGTNGSDISEDESGIGSTLLEPKITARYPEKDHADQPLNLRLPQFCHPEGTELIHPTTTYKMPRVHHFVLTDSLGGKQYGTALTVYEEYKDYGILLERRRSSLSEGGDTSNPAPAEGGGGKQKTYYAPRVLCLLSTYPYLTAFRTYLTQLYRLATTTNVMTVPIERYIQNICAEVPAPPPGAFEVQLKILQSDIRFWAPPANQPIAYVSLPFQVLFECLDIGNILFAWYTLACERKVLLVSGQLSLLTVCSEILCSLLFPMKWSHLYIPVLPRSLTPMLDAPMPYLCGISRENFPYAVEDISDETVVVDLDRNVITLGPNTPDLPPLPHNRRKKLEGTLKTHVGEVFWEARNLTKADVLRVRASGDEGTLSQMLDSAGAVWEEKIHARDDAFNLAFAPDSVAMQFDEDANVEDTGKQSRWDAVQEAFLRFYVSLLQDYRKFLPDDTDGSLQERSTWRGPSGLSDLRFQKEEFVASSPSEFQPFLEELTMTQQFDDFVTRKMHNAADAPDIKFFDQSIDAKKNRSKLKLKKKETPFLHSASAHRDLKSVQAVKPSGEGLAQGGGNAEGGRVYMYKMWPVNFNQELFGTPRPIPSIISAEFDRRGALRSMLRSKYGIVDESRGLGGRNRSPEVTAFILFFATFTSVIGKELDSVEQKHGGQSSDDEIDLVSPYGKSMMIATGSSPRQLCSNHDDDMEVARTIAKAQIDLGYHTLTLMRARKLPPEPMVYKLLIQACGRCKVTHRASGLMDMLARDGLATNSEIYTSLITAFSADNESQPSSLALYRMHVDDNMSSLTPSDIGSNANLLERNTSHSSTSLDLISEMSPMESTTTSGSGSKKRSVKGSLPRISVNKQMFKNVGGKSKRKMASPSMSSKKHHLKVTAAIAKQIELGESLLESLYPSIEIDTENVCPKCAKTLNEAAIGQGWTPCASNEYQTKCPSCSHKFVPKFSVSCNSPSFEGSQGKGTPLYCDHLSPWVLLREIRSVITATGGIDSIIDEKFRSGPDISATLWWNCIVLFQRYKLPYLFLLQGSFHNNLILPSPSLSESMNEDMS